MSTTDIPSDDTAAERMTAERLVAAPPSAVYALLTDPRRHPETEPTDWVRGALDPVETISAVGQVFGIEMFHENAGGRYDMHNRVIALEPERVIAWEPCQYGPDGTLAGGGWTWRYELAPAGEDGAGTRVRLVYDWSATPQVVRDEIGGLPPFPPEFLEQSLAALAGAVEEG